MTIPFTLIHEGISYGILEGTKVPEKPTEDSMAQPDGNGGVDFDLALLQKYESDLQALLSVAIRWEDQEAAHTVVHSQHPICCTRNGDRLDCANETCWDLNECQGLPVKDGIYPLLGVEAEKIRQFKVPPTRPTHLRFDAAVWHDSDLPEGTQDKRLEYRTVLRLIPQPNSEQKIKQTQNLISEVNDMFFDWPDEPVQKVEGTEVSEPTALEAAKELVNSGFPVGAYINGVQKEREDRLLFWESRGIKILIKKESELIQFGREVIEHMKKLKP